MGIGRPPSEKIKWHRDERLNHTEGNQTGKKMPIRKKLYTNRNDARGKKASIVDNCHTGRLNRKKCKCFSDWTMSQFDEVNGIWPLCALVWLISFFCCFSSKSPLRATENKNNNMNIISHTQCNTRVLPDMHFAWDYLLNIYGIGHGERQRDNE